MTTAALVALPDLNRSSSPVPRTPSRAVFLPGSVIGGVDTHKDLHVAAALNGLGRLLGTKTFPTTQTGYRALARWLATHGTIAAIGVEGTGCWGAGLTRHLTDAGHTVIEVHRPNRQRRRLRGKTDTIDAEEAARSVLSGDATATPKTATGIVEAVRLLRIARRGAVKARGQAINSLHSLVDTAPEDVRTRLRDLPSTQLITTCAALRPAAPTTALIASKYALALIARRLLILQEEITDLTRQLDHLTATASPTLTARHGIGTDTLGALLVAAGDNPHRLRSDASFAAMCGASPVQASSGRTIRHRLNRGGNREANSALWRIVMVRMGTDPTTKAYVARRTAEGLSKPEIMRCLKRYVARQVYRELTTTITTSAGLQQPLSTTTTPARPSHSPTPDTPQTALPTPR